MVDSVSSAASAATNSSSASTSGNSKTMISSDFETFLRMLTTQLENQDPLNPMESSDYALQIATFSGVEQQVQTNELLKALSANLGGGGLSQYGSWVGMEGQAAVPANYDGVTPVTVFPEIDKDASTAKLVVRDDTGAIVQSEPIPPDTKTILWSGGEDHEAGLYDFIVESYAEDGSKLSEAQARIYAQIAEVRTNEGEISIVFDSGTIVKASEVSALRDPV
ncbi:flagellar basal body rod modification protein [Rhodovulum sp. BSW8]|uniref:Basal-body rod modification protein FlgD n=1 Tax=Rhodovulum visakhapatnamense TaxID=364297 RepID=A0A4V3GT01_9RHOB|nr:MULTISPECIES: flagellar hook capping FlgD N-terminal domain-containing protein [Rhodovulum]OLS43633.1 hypothetical protein BV509_04335 [Rhodovulum sulfidophilum]MBL3568974.1 flagellar hook assembly protein FlgD [Rhodovulum visakhapatnamense]MBL3578095.1 flagellar hook assembly protein FlgD [Rhodovulum visakhapatnamense]RBO51214.1 flagellar basal body rod modification protein [Rhodovulum sp. BSW8]TDX24873.1 flagellar basal-body rod modification protein FlgD [Rhodovulum visakhapatnamense]